MSGYSRDSDYNWGGRFGVPRFGGSRSGPLLGKKFGTPWEKLISKKCNFDELPTLGNNFDKNTLIWLGEQCKRWRHTEEARKLQLEVTTAQSQF